VRVERGSGPVLLKPVENGYDASGDLTSVKTSVLPGSGHLLRTMGYDTSGNLTSVKSERVLRASSLGTAEGSA